MRLDFNILWVEDQKNNVQDQLKRVSYLIRREGFRLQAEFAASVDDAIKFLGEDIFGDHIDLILMDYDLGAGTKGDQGLVEVRNIFSYKDIIFYSSEANNLLEMVSKHQVQGVYCSTRNDLPDTIAGVFETLVKKVVDIDHSRGIVMGATSDIDHFVNDCLSSIFAKCDADAKLRAISMVLERTAEIRERFNTTATELEAIKHVDELFDKHTVYTSVDRLNLLRKLLKLMDIHDDKADRLKAYVSQTMPRRNELAHVQVRTKGFSRRLFDRKGNEFTSEQMKELRVALLEYQELFEQLSSALKAVERQ